MNTLGENEVLVRDRVLDSDALMLAFQVLRPDEARSFMLVLRLLLPHQQPELEFARLATALVLDAKLLGDPDLRALIEEGLRTLDASSLRDNRVTFSTATDDQRLDALRKGEDSPFFQTLLHIAKADFYNRHIVWRVLGYPDLEHEAGYIDDGFEQLDLRQR